MRIGNVGPRPLDKRRLSIWFSPRDFAQLVSIGVDHPGIKFEIVYGISGNKRSLVRQFQRLAPRLPPARRFGDLRRRRFSRGAAGHRPDRRNCTRAAPSCTAEDVPNPAAPQKKGKKKKK